MNEKYFFGNPPNRSTLEYNEPELCPVCKHSIKPEAIKLHLYSDQSGGYRFCALYLCHHCFHPFVSSYSCHRTSGNNYDAQLEYTEPNRHEDVAFDPEIELLSPRFIRIYNQALAAEEAALDEIAGVGYRKAAEILIKDYCIKENPDHEEEIKKMFLSNCIKTYIHHPPIVTLATKISWIGNDETHYVRVHVDRDVYDLKKFISAMVHYIETELIVEDAASISHA